MFLTREFRVAPAMILWFWRVTTYQVWISWSQKQIIIVKASKQNLWTTLIPYLLINFSRRKSLCGTEISSNQKKAYTFVLWYRNFWRTCYIDRILRTSENIFLCSRIYLNFTVGCDFGHSCMYHYESLLYYYAYYYIMITYSMCIFKSICM